MVQTYVTVPTLSQSQATAVIAYKCTM